MNNRIRIIIAGLLIAGSAFTFYSFSKDTECCATCTGSKSCNACKNCKYCKHCAKEGGTCGVCK